MEGTAYLVAQMVVVLVIVTLIGGGIGWLLAKRSIASSDVAVTDSDDALNTELVAEVAGLRSEVESSQGTAAWVKVLEAELEQARRDIKTGEDGREPRSPDQGPA